MMALAGTLKVVIGIHLIRSALEKVVVRSKRTLGIRGILAWILVSFHQRPNIPAPLWRKRALIRNDMGVAFNSYLSLVEAVFDMDPVARETLLNTPLALDVVLFFWDAINEDGKPFIMYQPYKQLDPEAAATTSCTLLNLAISFLRYGREFEAGIALFDRIEEGRTSDPWMCVESASMRIEHVVQDIQDDPRQPHLAASNYLPR
jgi:hypothetical protein